jgi:hypothetical protein
MEGCPAGQEGQATTAGWRRDLALLAVLLTLTTALRLWLLCNTEVAARDSIGFIRYALQLERDGWAEVLARSHQHPGYPVTVLAVSIPVRAVLDAPLTHTMQLSAQLASSLAALLLVIPMYFLGKLLIHRAAGFWGALLFQCLPVSGHALSDGLSEALFLLLTACALLSACQALRGRSAWRFAVCGAFCGLAYLTRPEGALLLAAVGLVLLGSQLAPAWRRRPGEFLRCGAALAVAAAAAGSPYYLATGQLTNKPSALQILGGENPDGASLAPGPRAALAPLAAVPAVAVDLDGALGARLLRGLWGLTYELANSFHWFAWLPAVVGMCWYRGLVRTAPGVWVLLVYCALHALVLLRLAAVVGYVSDRHVLALLLCGVYPAAGLLWDLGGLAARWLRARTVAGETAGGLRRWLSRPGVVSVVLLVLLVGTSLPRTLQTLHARRAGFRDTGHWLAANTQAADSVFDAHGWAYYYAGRLFLEGSMPRPAADQAVRWYHVVTRSRGKTDASGPPAAPHPHLLTEEEVRARGGRLVYHWPPRGPEGRAQILVYALPPGNHSP